MIIYFEHKQIKFTLKLKQYVQQIIQNKKNYDERDTYGINLGGDLHLGCGPRRGTYGGMGERLRPNGWRGIRIGDAVIS